MKYITDNETLRRHIPNAFREAAGERSYFDKIAPFIEQAEEWFDSELIGEWITDIPLPDSLLRGVAAMAMWLAIPSLDLVLTPNGFGVISTESVAPASAQRVAALRESMLEIRDSNIKMLLSLLRNIEEWRITETAKKFTQSLLSSPEDADMSYDKYRHLTGDWSAIEDEIAERYISPQLMAALRESFGIGLSPQRRWLRERLQRLVLEVQDNGYGCFAESELARMVDVVRKDPANFPEWHSSATSELFTPPVFRNEKRSSGYWF